MFEQRIINCYKKNSVALSSYIASAFSKLSGALIPTDVFKSWDSYGYQLRLYLGHLLKD